MKYLLDTNVFREIGKSQPHPHVEAWLTRVDDVELALSAISVREVRKGIAKLRGRKPEIANAIEARVAETLDAFADRVLPIDRAVAELWGELLAENEKHIDDTGLAATARIHNLVLVTRNLADVATRGADTLDPYKPSPKVNRVKTGSAP